MHAKGRDRTVFQREDGKWLNKRNDTDKISTRHATQKEAIEAALVMIAVQGGGELTVKAPNGEIQDTLIVPAANETEDGYPSSGKET